MNLVIEIIFGVENVLCGCNFEVNYQELNKGFREENIKNGENDFLNLLGEK